MSGSSTPDLHAIAVRIADALKSVSGMPSEIVHDKENIRLTEEEGLYIEDYDFGKGARHYWEVRGPLSGDDIEIPARDYFVDVTEWQCLGVFGFSNKFEDGESSTQKWRAIVKAVRDVLRKNLTVMGAVHRAPRGTRLITNRLVLYEDGSLVHFVDVRLSVESITEISV